MYFFDTGVVELVITERGPIGVSTNDGSYDYVQAPIAFDDGVSTIELGHGGDMALDDAVDATGAK